MKLYTSPMSPYAARARIVVQYKQLPVEFVSPTKVGGLHSPGFRAINPIDKMPVLVLDDGTAIPESEVILDYLEDRFPTPSLLPATAEARARSRLIARIAEIYVMGAFTPLLLMMPIVLTQPPTPRDPKTLAAGSQAVERGLDLLEQFLDKRGPLACGTQLTFADCSVVPFLVFIEAAATWFERPDWFSSRPTLATYYQKNVEQHAILGPTKQEVAVALQERIVMRSKQLAEAAAAG